MANTQTLTRSNTTAIPAITLSLFVESVVDKLNLSRYSDSEKYQILELSDGDTETSYVTREIEMQQKWQRVRRVFDSIVSNLEFYEAEFGMDSDNFYHAFQSGEIAEEREEFYDWRSAYSAYQRMHERFGLSR